MHSDSSGKTEMVKQKTKKASSKGRPPLAPEQRKRVNVTIRMRDQMKADLMSAGAAEGRSLSEEIEYRLEQSPLFGDPAFHSLMVILAATKKHIEEKAREEGLTIDETRAAILSCWTPLLKQMVLSDFQLRSRDDREDRGTAFGKGMAEWILAAAAEVDVRRAEDK